MTRQRIYISVGIFALVCGFCTVLLLHGHFARASVAEELAKKVEGVCTNDTDKETCYQKNISALYPAYSLTDVFNVIRAVRTEDPSYQFCHVLGHLLGEAVVAEDPAQWADTFRLNPTDGLCSNGFIHGVIGGRFRDYVLDASTTRQFIPEFSAACEPREDWKPTLLDEAMCYHAMGHLYVMITNADLSRALALCGETAGDKGTGDYRDRCFEGVFMQIYQPLEDSDYDLIRKLPIQPTAHNVRTFCALYKENDYVGACLRESWPLFRDQLLDGDGMHSFCSGQPDKKAEDVCYLSVSSIIGRMSLDEPKRINARCSQAPPERVATCVTMAARAVLEEDRSDSAKAIGVCQESSPDVVYQCIGDLVDAAVFTLGNDTPEYRAFCAALPEPYTGACR